VDVARTTRSVTAAWAVCRAVPALARAASARAGGGNNVEGES